MNNNFTESDIAGMLKTIPAPLPYPEWMRVVSAVYSVLPFAPGARLLQAWSPETVPGEYANKHKARMEQVTIGSLVHIAQRNGWKGEAGWKGKVRFAPIPARTPELIAAAAALPLPSWLCRPPATPLPRTADRKPQAPAPPRPAPTRPVAIATPAPDTIPPTIPRKPVAVNSRPAPAGYCTECWWTWSRALRPGSCICTGDVALRPGHPKNAMKPAP